jgi:hypothetical protein
MKFKDLLKDSEHLPIIEQSRPAKIVLDNRKEWYSKDRTTGVRTGRIPRFSLAEIRIIKQGNNATELLNECKNNGAFMVHVPLTLEEAENMALEQN